MSRPPRRRSPLWVRRLDDRVVHALAFRLNSQRTSEDLSEAQEWLFDACVSELEYRHRQSGPGRLRCSCALCLPPFVEYLD